MRRVIVALAASSSAMVLAPVQVMELPCSGLAGDAGSHAGVVMVTLPEEMPANETLELAEGVREMNLPIPRLVVNGLLPPLFQHEQRGLLLARELPLGLTSAHARASREQIQEDALAKLATLKLPTSYLPFLVNQEPSSPQAILALAHHL